MHNCTVWPPLHLTMEVSSVVIHWGNNQVITTKLHLFLEIVKVSDMYLIGLISVTKRSQHSQECKDNACNAFCDTDRWPSDPQNKWVSRTHREIFLLFYAKLGDPSCIKYWRIMQKTKHTDIPLKVEGSVGLRGWLHNEAVYPQRVTHLSIS